MRLLFASQNRHKMEEIKLLLPQNVELLNLTSFDFYDEIPETAPTLEGNALQKAQFIFEKFHIPCFADDTGLEIEALDKRPGVYSARYAGTGKSADENITKVLEELKNSKNRRALFKTVIVLVGIDSPLFFEGVVKGTVTKEKQGGNGFGYDPVFIPDGHSKTFAEMTMEEKNKLSHRAIAVNKFAAYLIYNL